MKTTIAGFFCFVLTMLSIALETAYSQQTSLRLNISITDKYRVPLADTEITLVETITQEEVSAQTDEKGKATIVLTKGHYWQMNIRNIRDNPMWQVEVEKNVAMIMNRSLVYDEEQYAVMMRPNLKRSAFTFISKGATSQTGATMIIDVKNSKKSPLAGVPVTLVYAESTTTAVKLYVLSGASGTAMFTVPINKQCEIDIGEVPCFVKLDAPPNKNMTITCPIQYEPSLVKETIVGDTVQQSFVGIPASSSARELVTITFHTKNGSVWHNEPVYLQTLKQATVYTGRTDAKGQVQFLLPKGLSYMIHGRYQNSIDVVNLSRSFPQNFSFTQKPVVYEPLERLQYPERFIPTPKDLAADEFISFKLKQNAQRPAAGEGLLAYAKWGSKVNSTSKDAILSLAFPSEAWDSTTVLPNTSVLPPLNVSFVIDCSGSMAGENIECLRPAVAKFIDKLRAEDVFSLVTFSSDKTTLIPSQPVNTNKAKWKELVQRLEANGGTDIRSGLMEGYAQVLSNFKKGNTNRVVLLTDGYGSDNPDTTIALSRRCNKQGVECSAIGVGDGFNYSFLRLLASHGGGLFGLAGKAEQISDVFAEEMRSLVYPGARDVLVEVEYDKTLLFSQLLGYPVESQKPGKLSLRLRNVYAGLDQLAFIKFTLINPTKAIERTPVRIRLSYLDVRQNKRVKKEITTSLQWSEASGELEWLLDSTERELYTTARMNQALKVMAESFSQRNIPQAITSLEGALNEIQSISPEQVRNPVCVQASQYLSILKALK